MDLAQTRQLEQSAHKVERLRCVTRMSNEVQIQALEIDVTPGPCCGDISSATHARVAVVLGAVGGQVESRLRPDAREPHGPFRMSFIPRGTQVWGYTAGIRRLRELRLDFDADKVAEAIGQKLTLPTAPSVFHSEPLQHLAESLAAECQSPGPFAQLYVDSLTLAACIDVLRLRPAGSARGPGRLTSWQLRRVTDYIMEHLADPLHLGDLARLAGLSQSSHFGRAFKASTGLPPHRWLLRARINKAQELLLARAMPHAEIALVTGFAEQSHFCRVFKQVVGISPAAWQHEHVMPEF